MSQFFSTKYKQGALDLSLLLLRVMGGGLMTHHGFEKIIHFTEKVKTFPDPLHIGSTLSLSLVIFSEFFCSVLLFFGLVTRLVSIPLIITMAVALFIVHHGEVFGDGESSTLFLTAFVILLLTGPGKYSLDRLIGK